jgi:hypothetical protein
MPVVGPSAAVAVSGSARDGGTGGTPSPSLAAELDRLERAGYRGYAAQQRAEYERIQREDRAAHLRAVAANHRLRANDLLRQEIEARRAGFTVRADHLDAQAGADTRAANELEDEAYAVLDGSLVQPRTEVDGGRDWDRINDDVGLLAPGGVQTGGVSALTGSDHPPAVDTTRRYGERGGSRPPLAAHQEDLERAMPRDERGNVLRTADPRMGGYFGLSNDGGPQADPTRAINCLDCVLSFYDTWVHGRPRVSAPRTFDAYANGDPTLPMDGEADGPGRVEDMTGGRYQSLCPDVGHLPPAQAHQIVDQAMNNLHQQLLYGGHGSFAFVITAWEGGSSHAWAAINQNGTILYVDPQSGYIRENAPLYGHFGHPYDGNVIMMDALITGPTGAPLPLANHPTGAWSARPPITSAPTPPDPGPTYGPTATPGPDPTSPAGSLPKPAGENPPDPQTVAEAVTQAEPGVNPEPARQETAAQAEELRLLDSLQPDHRAALELSIDQAGVVAAAVSADLHGIVGALDPVESGQRAQVVDEQHRVKGLASLARKFTDAFRLYGATPEEFLGEVNDRVRFSVQTPQHDYGRSVSGVLDQLRSRGYQIDVERDVKNFWHPGNRHNGVNVTARTPDGFTIEVQFPTKESRAVGKRTHALYEIVRLADATPTARVEALLDILRLNKESGISQRAPEGLDRLPAPVDTTFARWVQRNPEVWNRYQATLASEGPSFAEAVAQRGLGIEDFPGGERLGLQGGGAGVQLSRGVQAGQGPGSGEPDRGVGLGGPAAAGGPMEPPGPGVDLRPGDSSQDDLRRPTLRPGLPGGPVRGGANRPGDPGSRPAHRDAPTGDLRGGRQAGPEVASADHPPSTPDRLHDLPTSTGQQLDGFDGPVSPHRAAQILSALPRSEILENEPLPTLGGEAHPVRRDQCGLIADVYSDGQWVGVATYLGRLTDERAEIWRRYAADIDYPDIVKGTANPCISIVIDRRTGQLAEAHNNLGIRSEDLHPLVRARLDEYLQASDARPEPFDWGSRTFHPSAPGEHSEIFAVSELLWSRTAAGYPTDESVMRELRVDNRFPWRKGGMPAPCCGNCTAIIPDVPCNSGKLPYFRAPKEEVWPE